MPVVAFDQLTEAEQRRLKAANITDSVIIARNRSDSSRESAALNGDSEEAVVTAAEPLLLDQGNCESGATPTPHQIHLQAHPAKSSLQHAHVDLPCEPFGQVSPSGILTPSHSSRDGQARPDG